MSSFCPNGYVPTLEAILEVAEKWFEQRLREVETLVASELASKAEPKSGVEALARALSQPPIRPRYWNYTRISCLRSCTAAQSFVRW